MVVDGGKLSTRKSDSNPVAAELRRLDEANRLEKDWRRWGPYLPERQWATVREDYSPDGTCWEYFPHDHARRRAYRWGEDGLLGFCDRKCRLAFAPALWNGKDPILNLEQGKPATEWGRLIFYVVDVDASWTYLKGRGFDPERPRDASWGERYFHMPDPDGHELSFARPT